LFLATAPEIEDALEAIIAVEADCRRKFRRFMGWGRKVIQGKMPEFFPYYEMKSIIS